jgi:DNA repair protein RecN (Recombination protein N)
MLHTLRIRQFVIIEDLTIEFGKGFNLLTGETGAGKSILVDALGWIAGARADRSLVRRGAARARVEALFVLDECHPLRDWARAQGLEDWVEEDQITVRREVAAEGGGRVLINGSPATVGQLREIASLLLELHGQHEQQSLLSSESQRAILDHFGGHAAAVQAVADAFETVRRARGERDELEAAAAARNERIARLEAEIREIESVAPEVGELDKIDRERAILQNAERMRELLDESVSLAYDGEPSAAEQAAAAARRTRELAELDPGLAELAGRIQAAAVELEDAGAALRDYRQRGNFDPARLGELEERRVALERLRLAYGRDEHEVLERLAAAREELARLDDVDRSRAEAAASVFRAEEAYLDAARRLTRARLRAAKKLAGAVEEQLAALALPKARFAAELEVARGEEVADAAGRPYPLSRHGMERTVFQLAANPGEPLRPLAKVASGGELSRIMLALHSVARKSLAGRALVFDEIDAGIGGPVADAIGARLARLAGDHQVFCVTHLPQVAAHAGRHFVVGKSVSGGRTRVRIEELEPESRVEELARMLGGRETTDTSLQHASELLSAAGGRRSS